MSKILIVLALIVAASFVVVDSSKEAKACFGCDCTNSCGGSAP